MTTVFTSSHPFHPGTTGWTADDLDDPAIERRWEQGAYEIVEGVLTKIPPAYLDGSLAIQRLTRLIQHDLDNRNLPGDFAPEADLILERHRVARLDAVFLLPEDLQRQEQANAGRRWLQYGRLRIAPTLIVESVSIGHEDHDQETKRRWYAEATVPNYWVLNAYEKTLECLVLKQGAYQVDQLGRGDSKLRLALFPGLVLPLKRLWGL